MINSIFIFRKAALFCLVFGSTMLLEAQNRADILFSYAHFDYQSSDEKFYTDQRAMDILKDYDQVQNAEQDGFKVSDRSSIYSRNSLTIHGQQFLRRGESKGTLYYHYGVEQFWNNFIGSTRLSRSSPDGQGNVKYESIYYRFSVYQRATQINLGMGYQRGIISNLKRYQMDGFASAALNLGVNGRVYITENLDRAEVKGNSLGHTLVSNGNKSNDTHQTVRTERLISFRMGIKQSIKLFKGSSLGVIAAFRYDANISGRELLIASKTQQVFAEFGAFVRF